MNVKYPNIEAERIRSGLTQQELSERIGITRKCYYNWQLSGHIPASKILVMADLFDCSTDYLLGRSDMRKYPTSVYPL